MDNKQHLLGLSPPEYNKLISEDLLISHSLQNRLVKSTTSFTLREQKKITVHGQVDEKANAKGGSLFNFSNRSWPCFKTNKNNFNVFHKIIDYLI